MLVTESHVTGWDDPRMSILSGIRSHNLQPAVIRLFCERMGISKTDSNTNFGILEDCTRDVFDDKSPREFATLDPFKVSIANWGGEFLLVYPHFNWHLQDIFT